MNVIPVGIKVVALTLAAVVCGGCATSSYFHTTATLPTEAPWQSSGHNCGQRWMSQPCFNITLRMKNVVEQARLVLTKKVDRMTGPHALREIFRLGTSAGGAQAKVVVGWNPDEDRQAIRHHGR